MPRMPTRKRDDLADLIQEDRAKRASIMPGLGDGAIEPAVNGLMNDIAGTLDLVFNSEDGKTVPRVRKTGFVLLTFPYGDETGRCNFISNGADRRDIVTMFREMIGRFEGAPIEPGGGKSRDVG